MAVGRGQLGRPRWRGQQNDRALPVGDPPHPQWPERWRRLGGIDAQQARPRGVTSTIADLLSTARAAHGEIVMATIAGEVTVRSGSGEGSILRVRDATGELLVWCPPAAHLYFDGSSRSEWELDVGMRWNDAAQDFSDDRARSATSDDIDDRILARFLDAGGLAPDMAVAGAIRPLRLY